MSSENPTCKYKQKYYASLYGRSIRTIAEYWRVGAPLDNPEAMKSFLDQKDRKKTGSHQPGALPVVDGDEVDAMSKGAAEALRRLEAAEASGAVAVKKAEEGGDPCQVEAATIAWLRACRELRYFDKAVNFERRDGLELIPKSEAVNSLKALTYQMLSQLFATIDYVGDYGPDDRKWIRYKTIEGFKSKLMLFQKDWPKWMLDVISNTELAPE
jgi:hypothetical protein